MVSLKRTTDIDEFLLPNIVRFLHEQTANRLRKFYNLTVVCGCMVPEGEICAAAEDERMRMRCSLKWKEMENGAIVYVGDVKDHNKMG